MGKRLFIRIGKLLRHATEGLDFTMNTEETPGWQERKLSYAYKNMWMYQWRYHMPVFDHMRGFDNFKQVVGEPPSPLHILARHDVTKNHSRDNSFWDLTSEMRKRCWKDSDKVATYEIGGERLTIAQLAERCGSTRSAVLDRIHKGRNPLQSYRGAPRKARTRLTNDVDLDKIKPAHRQIIEARLNGESLRSIGERFGVTRQRVAQIEKDVREGRFRKENRRDARYVG